MGPPRPKRPEIQANSFHPTEMPAPVKRETRCAAPGGAAEAGATAGSGLHGATAPPYPRPTMQQGRMSLAAARVEPLQGPGGREFQFRGDVQPVGGPGPQRFQFNIDPKTPVKDLLPTLPKSARAAAPVLPDDLSKVPEAEFQAPLAKDLGAHE